MGNKKAKGYSLSPKETEIIERVNTERRLENESLALRQIIHEWNEMQVRATQPTHIVKAA